MTRTRVVVIKTSPETVFEDYKRITELAGIENFLDKRKSVILKDNISWHYPFPGANTTPWQLEGVIKALKGLGYTELVAVHNNTVVTDPFKGGRLNLLTPIYKKYQLPELYNFLRKDIKWVLYKPEGKMLVLDRIYPEGIYIPEYFIGKNIVHLPTMKCHIYTTTTGAMKNAFGGLLNTKRHYTHSVIHKTLVDLLRIQKEIHSGIFAVMDGTTAGDGPGPRTMKPVETCYILASGDSVAIDAVAAKMMGFEPLEIGYIRLAHNAKLGVGDPREIEVIGEEISAVNLGFSVGNNLASFIGNKLWFGPFKFLQKLFFHTPLVYILVFSSAFYHDYLWWPTKGKRIFKTWSGTKWGRLFKKYKE